MSYQEIPPQPGLETQVRCCWILEEPADLYNRDSILPDSYLEVIINCGAPLRLIGEQGQRVDLPPAFLVGLHQKPLPIEAQGFCQLIGIRLYVWSAVSLLTRPMNPAYGAIQALDRGWQQQAQHIAHAARHRGCLEAVYDLQQFAREQRQTPPSDLYTLQLAGQRLYSTRGQSRIRLLSDQSGLSLSQFERHFRRMAGMTPKMFARLIRFEAIRNALVDDPAQSAITLALDLGYTDQAHFIHDFRAFAGSTPGQYMTLVKAQARAWENAEFLQYP